MQQTPSTTFFRTRNPSQEDTAYEKEAKGPPSMERIDQLILHGINYPEAMERFGGNEALFVRLATKFLNDTHFSSLETALAENNAEEAHRQAHSLKGVAGNLSFDVLYREASFMSDSLREGSVTEAIKRLPVARAAYDNVMAGLRELV